MRRARRKVCAREPPWIFAARLARARLPADRRDRDPGVLRGLQAIGVSWNACCVRARDLCGLLPIAIAAVLEPKAALGNG